MIPLSPKTRQHLATLFAPEDRDEAARLLETECAYSLGEPKVTPKSLERLRFATLRVSGGRLDGMQMAIQAGKTDWRDLLMWAGFGDQDHEPWQPRRLDPQELEGWRQGASLAGVDFQRGERVGFLWGLKKSKTGTVADLLALEPLPYYQIELTSGETYRAYQNNMKKVE